MDKQFMDLFIDMSLILLMGGCLIATAYFWPEKRVYEKEKEEKL